MHASENNVYYGPAMRDWYGSAAGQVVLEQEARALNQVLPDLFGYHLLQIGSCGQDVLGSSRILHRMVMDVSDCSQHIADGFAGLCAVPDHLPIASDSVDAVLLYHSLEFSQDPHQVLREVERVLVPEGHVLIMGFNPRSLWGLRAMMHRRGDTMPWNGKFVNQPRLRDWLSLLGFDVQDVQPLCFQAPLKHVPKAGGLPFMARWGVRWWPYFCGVYLMTARKKVSTMTPIKPRWQPRRRLVPGLSEPASRGMQRNGRS